MYLANTTGADSRFPGPAHPPRFAELPLHQLHVSPTNRDRKKPRGPSLPHHRANGSRTRRFDEYDL